MTKARQRERAKRKKLIARHLAAVPMSAVHGFVNGVEWPLKSWDGHKIQFHEPPPEGAVVTISVDTTKKVIGGHQMLDAILIAARIRDKVADLSDECIVAAAAGIDVEFMVTHHRQEGLATEIKVWCSQEVR